MSEPVDDQTAAGEPDEKPPTWKIFGIDYDRRRVEWVLWGLSDDVQIYLGRVEANGGVFFEGSDFDRAVRLFHAFVNA